MTESRTLSSRPATQDWVITPPFPSFASCTVAAVPVRADRITIALRLTGTVIGEARIKATEILAACIQPDVRKCSRKNTVVYTLYRPGTNRCACFPLTFPYPPGSRKFCVPCRETTKHVLARFAKMLASESQHILSLCWLGRFGLTECVATADR